MTESITPIDRGIDISRNPEPSYAAVRPTNFLLAMELVVGSGEIELPPGVALGAEVVVGTPDGKFMLRARLSVQTSGAQREAARVA